MNDERSIDRDTGAASIVDGGGGLQIEFSNEHYSAGFEAGPKVLTPIDIESYYDHKGAHFTSVKIALDTSIMVTYLSPPFLPSNQS